MENTENTNSKKPNLSTIIIFLVLVLAIIGLFIIKSTKDNKEQNVVDTATTTQEKVATSTDPATSSVDSSQTTKPQTNTVSPTVNTGVTVIQGDGYTATLKPVTGEAPIINSFVMNKVAETCRFTWDVSKAKRCDLLNSETKEGIKNIGSNGTVQMNDAGDYILRCYGDGGKSVTSDVVSCK